MRKKAQQCNLKFETYCTVYYQRPLTSEMKDEFTFNYLPFSLRGYVSSDESSVEDSEEESESSGKVKNRMSFEDKKRALCEADLRKPVTCTVCRKVCKDRKVWEDHFFPVHFNMGRFECPEPGCGKKFARNINLKRHLTVHKKDKRKTKTIKIEKESK